MRERSVAVLVANNGLGHARRALGFLRELLRIEPTLDSTVVLSEQTLGRLPSLGDSAEVIARHRTTIRVVRGGIRWPVYEDPRDRGRRWIEDVSRLEEVWNAELVVSDNYTDIFAIRPDAVLMGSFLWSDVLAQVRSRAATEAAEHEYELLAEHQPPMLCVGELATPGVLNRTRAVRLPYLCPPSPRGVCGPPAGRSRRGIGVTVGTTTAATSLAESCIPVLAAHYPVVVDPVLARRLPADVRALVSVTSAARLVREVELLICRPGMGTLTDAVDACVPMVVFAERGQAEMQHLLHRLPTLGLAVSAGIDPCGRDVLEAVRFATAEPAYSRITRCLAARKRGGTEAAARWCSERLLRAETPCDQ
jgi:hypothetical protein